MKFTKKVIDSHIHIKTSGNRWFNKEGKTYIVRLYVHNNNIVLCLKELKLQVQ